MAVWPISDDWHTVAFYMTTRKCEPTQTHPNTADLRMKKPNQRWDPMKSKAISTTKTKRKIIRITTRITLITAKETTTTTGEGKVVVVSV